MDLEVLQLVNCEVLLIVVLQVEFLIVHRLQHSKGDLSVALIFIPLWWATTRSLTYSDGNEIDEKLDRCVVHWLSCLLADHVHGLCNLILIDVITFAHLGLSKYLSQVLASTVRIGLDCLQNWRQASKCANPSQSSFVLDIFLEIWFDVSKAHVECLLVSLIEFLKEIFGVLFCWVRWDTQLFHKEFLELLCGKLLLTALCVIAGKHSFVQVSRLLELKNLITTYVHALYSILLSDFLFNPLQEQGITDL